MLARNDKVRLMIRVFVHGLKLHQEYLEESSEQMDQVLPRLGEKHAAMMADSPGYVEIEFLDEPDETQRFFRMGTDRTAMVNPIAIDPSRPMDVISRWGSGKRR